jgi:NAD(P)-dependent dehydrogenase (short-subunit alcohol dehydrogenase family)
MTDPHRKPSVLVTDALGFANPVIIQMLLEAGAQVLACDPAIIDDAYEGGVQYLGWTQPETLVERAVAAATGVLDAIVIAPATPAPRTPIGTLSRQQLEPLFDRLALEALVFAGAAAKHMLSIGAGRIVFVSSAGPIGGIPGFCGYAAARSAVNGAVKSLSLELALYGISVNAIAPNFIQTETYYPKALLADPVKGPRLLARVPMGRLGRAEEVAALVKTFALGDVGFVSGQIIPIAGASS